MRAGLIAMTAALAVALTGCASSDASAPAAAPQGGGAATSDHNDADVKFSMEMIPHHQQTIQIADLASQRATGEKAKLIAAKVLSAEEKEIRTMTGWLKSWNQAPPAAGHAGHDMPGMLTAADIKALESASGKAFDDKFLPMILKHLQNGVTMAKQVISDGQHQPTKDLAGQIVTSQQKKIAELQADIT